MESVGIYALLSVSLLVNVFTLVKIYTLERGKESNRFSFRPDQVSGSIAARILEDYREDLGVLSVEGIRAFSAERYALLSAASGLPIQYSDHVADLVLERVEEVQKHG